MPESADGRQKNHARQKKKSRALPAQSLRIAFADSQPPRKKLGLVLKAACQRRNLPLLVHDLCACESRLHIAGNFGGLHRGRGVGGDCSAGDHADQPVYGQGEVRLQSAPDRVASRLYANDHNQQIPGRTAGSEPLLPSTDGTWPQQFCEYLSPVDPRVFLDPSDPQTAKLPLQQVLSTQTNNTGYIYNGFDDLAANNQPLLLTGQLNCQVAKWRGSIPAGSPSA